jgi:hypothetical protein
LLRDRKVESGVSRAAAAICLVVAVFGADVLLACMQRVAYYRLDGITRPVQVDGVAAKPRNKRVAENLDDEGGDEGGLVAVATDRNRLYRSLLVLLLQGVPTLADHE